MTDDDSNSFPTWAIYVIIGFVIAIVLGTAAILYWRRRRARIRDEVRGILREYLPLTDEVPSSAELLPMTTTYAPPPAEEASATSSDPEL